MSPGHEELLGRSQALLAAAPADGGAAPGALDLAKAARLLSDVADIGAEADLSGLEAAAADEELLRSADQHVRSQAEVGTHPWACSAVTSKSACKARGAPLPPSPPRPRQQTLYEHAQTISLSA